MHALGSCNACVHGCLAVQHTRTALTLHVGIAHAWHLPCHAPICTPLAGRRNTMHAQHHIATSIHHLGVMFIFTILYSSCRYQWGFGHIHVHNVLLSMLTRTPVRIMMCALVKICTQLKYFHARHTIRSWTPEICPTPTIVAQPTQHLGSTRPFSAPCYMPCPTSDTLVCPYAPTPLSCHVIEPVMPLNMVVGAMTHLMRSVPSPR